MVRFRELTADERTRDLYERREKARRDQAMFMRHERQLGMWEGRVAIARNMITGGEPVERIKRFTDLTCEEIETLK